MADPTRGTGKRGGVRVHYLWLPHRHQEGKVGLKEWVMDQKIFAELLESANEALEHAKGKRELRTTELPPPPTPVDGGGFGSLRTRLKMSQAGFARYLIVITKIFIDSQATR